MEASKVTRTNGGQDGPNAVPYKSVVNAAAVAYIIEWSYNHDLAASGKRPSSFEGGTVGGMASS